MDRWKYECGAQLGVCPVIGIICEWTEERMGSEERCGEGEDSDEREL